MQFRNKALAGIAVMIALGGCASQEKKAKTVSQTDQQKGQLAYEQQMAYKSNVACKNAMSSGLQQQPQAQPPQQAGGTAPVPKDTAQITAPTGTSGCNCSCLSNPEKKAAAEATP